jgi:hypothetical protein
MRYLEDTSGGMGSGIEPGGEGGDIEGQSESNQTPQGGGADS